MSFAPVKQQVSRRSPGTSFKQHSQLKWQDEQDDESLRTKIIALEDTVAQLQLQQDMLEPLVSLLTRASDVMALEDHAKSFLDQANVLEHKIEWQSQLARDIEKKIKEVTVPSSISEGLGPSTRSLPDMLCKVTDIEASVLAISMQRRTNAKRQESTSKEQFRNVLENLKSGLIDSQLYIKECTNQFHNESLEKIDQLDEKGNELRGRQKRDQSMIENALEDHVQMGGTEETWLHDELSQRVQDSLKELREYVEYRYKQLELSFKQNLASIKASYTKCVQDKAAIAAIHEKDRLSIPGKVNFIKETEKRLETSGKTAFSQIKNVTTSLAESIAQLEEKLKLSAGSMEVEQWLKGIWFNLNLLRDIIHSTETQLQKDTAQLQGALEELAKQSSVKHSELAPRAQNLQSFLHRKLTHHKAAFAGLLAAHLRLWKTLQMPFTSSNPEDLALFESL